MTKQPIDLWYASRRTSQARRAWKYVICGTGLNGCLLTAGLWSEVEDVPSEDPFVFLRLMLVVAMACVVVAEIVVTCCELRRYRPVERSTVWAVIITAVNFVSVAWIVLRPVRY